MEEVPEYVVYWEGFVECVTFPPSCLPPLPTLTWDFSAIDRLAAEYGLHLTFHEDFQRIFVEERQDSQFADLLTRMKVVDRQGETEMTMDQWEAASECFCFSLQVRRGQQLDQGKGERGRGEYDAGSLLNAELIFLSLDCSTLCWFCVHQAGVGVQVLPG